MHQSRLNGSALALSLQEAGSPLSVRIVDTQLNGGITSDTPDLLCLNAYYGSFVSVGSTCF